MFEFDSPQRAFRERGASDGETQARRLPGDAALLIAGITILARSRPIGSTMAGHRIGVNTLILWESVGNVSRFGAELQVDAVRKFDVATFRAENRILTFLAVCFY
jgi:hypothetical protein